MSERPRPAPPQGPRGDRRDTDRNRSQTSYKLSYGRDSRDSIPPRSNAVSRAPLDRDPFNSRQDRGRNENRGGPRDLRGQRDQSNLQAQAFNSRRGNRGGRSNNNNNERNIVNSSSNSVAIGSKRMIPPSEPRGYRNLRDSTAPDRPTSIKRGPDLLSDHRDNVPAFKKPKNDRNNREENGRSRSQRGRGRRGNSGGPSGPGPQPPRGKRSDKPPALPKLKDLQIYSIKRNSPLEVYKRVQQVGEGTYGKVYKAQNLITTDFVALKKLRLETEREGFPITAIREIKLLQSFDHPNVINLLEMMVEKNQIFMVFDYLDHDLTGLLTHPDLRMEEKHRKFIFKQLMEGLNYLHKRQIIHRDIKGSNILLDSTGRLKIADFGLARTMKVVREGESPDYTNRVITIWYRPPELLMGATDYGREVDIWGVGCLLVELYSKSAVFQGFEELGQLCKIFNVMGTPSIDDWPDIENLPWFELLKPKVNIRGTFAETFEPLMLEHSFDLAKKLLALNPKNRLSTSEALKHPYFSEEPAPEPLIFLKDIEGEWHEFETKQQRRQERKRLQDVALAQRKTPSMPDADESANERPGLERYPGTGDVPMTQRSEGPETDLTLRQDSEEPAGDQSAKQDSHPPMKGDSSGQENDDGPNMIPEAEEGAHEQLPNEADRVEAFENKVGVAVNDMRDESLTPAPAEAVNGHGMEGSETGTIDQESKRPEESVENDNESGHRAVAGVNGASDVTRSFGDTDISLVADVAKIPSDTEASRATDVSEHLAARAPEEVMEALVKADILDTALDEASLN